MIKKLLFLTILFLYSGSLFAQGKWSVVTKMPYPVSGGQAVLYNDKIYILGGYSDSLQASVDWIQEYNVAKNLWRIAGHMLQPRENFVAAVWDTSLMFFGGVRQNSTEKENLASWNFRSEIQPAIFSTDPNFGRALSTGHIKNDYFYIIGGNPFQPDRTLPYILEYDLKSKAISYTLDTIYASAEKPQQQMTMLINNDLYILGGVYTGIMRTISRFNIVTKKYESLADKLIEPRAGGAAIFNSVINQAFILGGTNESNKALASVEQISVKSGGGLNIIKVDSLRFARKSPMVVNYKNTIIVFGGTGRNGKVVPEVESYVSDVVIAAEDEKIPTETKLFANYPNPFNPSTNVRFQLSDRANVSLDVYSVLGQHIITLEKGDLSRGYYEYQWDGKDINGKLVSSGVYLLTLRTQNFVQTKKMLFLK